MRLTHLNVKVKLHKRDSPLAFRGIVLKNVTVISVFILYLKPCKSYQIAIVLSTLAFVSYDSELVCPVPVKHKRNLDSNIYIIYGQQCVIGK